MMKLNRYVAREYDKHAFVANGYMKSISIQVQINNQITLRWHGKGGKRDIIKPLFILKDQKPQRSDHEKRLTSVKMNLLCFSLFSVIIYMQLNCQCQIVRCVYVQVINHKSHGLD